MEIINKKTFSLWTFIFAVCLSSCISDPITSYNRFVIDNQSSFELYYHTGAGIDERTIEIPRFSLTEIEVAVFDDDRAVLIQAEDFFIQTEDDVYLLRETDNHLIEVLQLNTLGVLNWEFEMVNDVTYKHTLLVTDDMLN